MAEREGKGRIVKGAKAANLLQVRKLTSARFADVTLASPITIGSDPVGLSLRLTRL